MIAIVNRELIYHVWLSITLNYLIANHFTLKNNFSILTPKVYFIQNVKQLKTIGYI